MAEQRAPGELVSNAATVDARKAIKIEQAVHIDRPASALYSIWHTFGNLPSYVPEIESVTQLSGGRWHWVALVPGGKRVEWDAELVNDIPNKLIAWKTVGNPDVAHAGSVHFDEAGGGTDMRVVIDYEPPGGQAGTFAVAFAKLFGQDPDAKLQDALEHFKKRVDA